MATWTRDELSKIEKADELQIASLRRDGTLRNPVTIWVVRLAMICMCAALMDVRALGSVARRRATKGIFARAASIKMSPLWKSLTCKSRSTLPIAQSIVATPQTSLEAS